MKKLKFRFIFPLLLAFVLALGSCMTACAVELYPYPEDFESLGYDVICKSNLPAFDYVVLTADAPCIFVEYSSSDYILRFSDITKYHIYTCRGGIFNDQGIKESSSYDFSRINDYYPVVYATFDIKDSFGKIFFRSPLARLAVPLKAEIKKQTKMILPVGVGCLALLIGSVVLLPRLRRSLLRL